MHCECYFKGNGEVRPHHHLGHLRPCGGVTLTELVVTLAIICIIAALAIPGLGAFSSRKAIINQADQMGAFFHHVRERSIQEGVHWRIVFKPEAGQWSAFGDINGNARYDPGEQRLGPYTLGQGIKFGSSAQTGPNNTAIPTDGISFVDDRVCFSPMGACNAGTVYLFSNDRSVALRILPASGTVLLYQYINFWRQLE